MAVTKIKSIKATVKKAIDYITNESKTDGSLLVSSYGCEPKTAHLEFKMTEEYAKVVKDKDYSKQSKNLAYHTIQSFKHDDNVTYELAHEIGMKLADELTQGKYQYVVSTHIDKGHVHNHIIFNATSFEDFKKFNCNKNVFKKIRAISDRLCEENGLSVIDHTESKSKGMDYKEWSETKKGTSWKAKLKEVMDHCIKESNSYEEFISFMKKSGYEVKEGKHIAFKAAGEGQQRFTRAKTIGENYTEEAIKARIANKEISNVNKLETHNDQVQTKPHISMFKRLVGHISTARKILLPLDKQVTYYSRRQQIKNVKELANTLMVIRKENIMNQNDFEAKITELKTQSRQIKQNIISINEKVAAYNEVAKYIHTVERTTPIYEKYQKAIMKKSFRSKHESEILSYEFATGKLQELKVDPSITTEKIVVLAKQFTQESSVLNENLNEVDRKIMELTKAQKIVREIVKGGREKQKEQQRRNREKDIEI